jgi:hypothetical protein
VLVAILTGCQINNELVTLSHHVEAALGKADPTERRSVPPGVCVVMTLHTEEPDLHTFTHTHTHTHTHRCTPVASPVRPVRRSQPRDVTPRHVTSTLGY